MTQKDKMLQMVLDDPKLQELYEYTRKDYDDGVYEAINSRNAIVSAVAKIIVELNGSDDPSEQKRVYQTIFKYLNDNLLA
ncbi:MAG: hypothetical protein Q4F82_09150 [bacterium]|nr:hypothetical protein [bacterium]